MHFPKHTLLPFIRDVDSYVREHANEVSFAQYGSKVIEVASHELQNNQLLKPKFKDILLTLVSGDLKGYDHAVNVNYTKNLSVNSATHASMSSLRPISLTIDYIFSSLDWKRS